jgi:hypothetical protein
MKLVFRCDDRKIRIYRVKDGYQMRAENYPCSNTRFTWFHTDETMLDTLKKQQENRELLCRIFPR